MAEEQEADAYNDAEDLLDDDEIDAEEEAFMRGYEEAVDEELTEPEEDESGDDEE